MTKKHNFLKTYGKYLNLITGTSDIIILIDRNRRIVEVNDRAVSAYGYPRHELQQMDIMDLVAYDCQPLALAQLDLLGRQDSMVYEKIHRRKDGTVFPAEIRMFSINIDGKKYYQAVIRDMTGRKEDESRFEVRNEILRLFAQTLSPAAYAEAMVEIIQPWVGCEYAGIQLLDEDGGVIGEFHRGARGTNHLAVSYFDLMETAATISADSPAGVEQLSEEFGFVSFAVIPMEHSGKRLGMLYLAGTGEKQLSFKKVAYIESVITVLIGERVHRFILEEKIRRHYEIQAILNQLLNLSLTTKNLEELLKKTLDLLLSIQWLALEQKGCIFLVEGEPAALVLKVWNGLEESLRKQCARLPWGRCLCGLAAATGEIQFASRLDSRHEISFPGIAPHGHYCVPILSGGTVLGVITLYLKEGHRRNVIEDEFMASIAKTLAGVIERRRTEEKLLATRRQFYNIIEFLPDATFVLNSDRKVIAWNRAMEQMTGINKGEVVGKGGYPYLRLFHGSPALSLVEQFFPGPHVGKAKGNQDGMNMIKMGDKLRSELFLPGLYQGVGAYVEVIAAPLYDENGHITGAIETIRDVSEHKSMENQLQYLAENDFLTNIPNRYSLEETLGQAVGKAGLGSSRALLLIGIDNFKLVNDTLGHIAGDEMLVRLTEVLKENLGKNDLLFRFGGDEFAVLVEEAGQGRGLEVAEKMRRVVDEGVLCFDVHETCFHLTISVGVVMVDGEMDAQKLLILAETALFTAKQEGKNRVVLMEPDEQLETRPTETNQMIGLIKNALREDGFILHCQPVVRIGDGHITHYEILLRLRGNDSELIMPGRFIPVAERFGLMPQIDRWVVEKSLQALAENESLCFFINLSGASLGDEKLLDYIESLIRNSGVDPSRIGFEVTETATVRDLMWARRWIQRIKGLGCSFALDDFGTGFSSFTYLRTLPVDYLKIDGSFVHNMDVDPGQRALVQTMHDLAQALGKKTIVEFVESADILKIARKMGVDYGQGYYFGVPSPLH